jgi:hypothetical protein
VRRTLGSPRRRLESGDLAPQLLLQLALAALLHRRDAGDVLARALHFALELVAAAQEGIDPGLGCGHLGGIVGGGARQCGPDRRARPEHQEALIGVGPRRDAAADAGRVEDEPDCARFLFGDDAQHQLAGAARAADLVQLNLGLVHAASITG